MKTGSRARRRGEPLAAVRQITDRRLRIALVAAGVCLAVSPTAAAHAQSTGRVVLPPAPTPPPRSGVGARIIGVAFDSIAMQPLANAVLQLVAASDPTRIRTATSNTRGEYTIDSVAVGIYLLGFFHPRLDSLGIESPLLRVDVTTDDELRASVAIPSGRTLVARLCGPDVAAAQQGMFMGFVRSARGEALSGPARIRAQWTEMVLGTRGVERRSPARYATTTAGGAFTICGIPTDGTFTTRAFVGTDSSGFVDLEAPANGLLVRDVYVGAASKVTVPIEVDTSERTLARTTAVVLRGNGKLRGTVKSSSGQPVQGARVQVWGSGIEAVTNAAGQFTMQSLPSGTYTLESRALGFMPRKAPVDVPDGVEGTTELAMDVFVPTVDTLRIRANRDPAYDPLAEFERRRKGGFGYFIDEDALNKRNAMYMSDVFRMTPGMTIMPGQLSGDQVLMRGASGSGSCVPAIYLNGVRVTSDDGVIDNIVNPQEVRAVEVYSRTASVPMQFQASNGCGSVVIWTGGRRSPGR